jgi:hypothetical protein
MSRRSVLRARIEAARAQGIDLTAPKPIPPDPPPPVQPRLARGQCADCFGTFGRLLRAHRDGGCPAMRRNSPPVLRFSKDEEAQRVVSKNEETPTTVAAEEEPPKTTPVQPGEDGTPAVTIASRWASRLFGSAVPWPLTRQFRRRFG